MAGAIAQNTERTRWRVAALVAATTTCSLAVLAAINDARVIDAQLRTTVMDLLVGVAFAAAAVVARRGDPLQRLLVASVGAAWLAGSSFSATRTLHQGVLLAALALHPDGRTRDPSRLAFVGVAVLMSAQVFPQLLVAAAFAALAANLAARDRRGAVVVAYPVGAGLAVAAALVLAWWAAQRSEPASPLMVYEICLLGIAATYPVAVRAVARHRGRLADRVLGAVGSAGLPGLQHVLAGVLTDPCLRIECWDAVAAAFEPVTTDAAADAVANRDDEETVLVTDDGVLLARVVTASRVLADRGTADAVVEAVRLAVVNQRLDADLAARRMELEHSRRRLIAAADRERERSATSLRRDVGAALERALVTLSDIRPYDGAAPQLAEALAEVQAATGDVERIVFGVPPVPLGSGRLSDGLRLLVARSPTPGNLHADPVAASTPENEAALYYVCSEALANVAKHAAAKVADVTLAVGADSLVLTVRDDGVGGADVTGSGLLGLSDRLAAVNGSLEIDSRPGCGTTVTATVPRTTG